MQCKLLAATILAAASLSGMAFAQDIAPAEVPPPSSMDSIENTITAADPSHNAPAPAPEVRPAPPAPAVPSAPAVAAPAPAPTAASVTTNATVAERAAEEGQNIAEVQETTSLNAEVNARVEATDSANVAARAQYEAALAAHEAAVAAAEKARGSYEAQLQAYEARQREIAEWEAKSKACTDGDRQACKDLQAAAAARSSGSE
jgi:hypothetical protein